jgi:hypothetical protein
MAYRVAVALATVGPVEDWIEAHRQLWSPNTVHGYATSLAQGLPEPQRPLPTASTGAVIPRRRARPGAHVGRRE